MAVGFQCKQDVFFAFLFWLLYKSVKGLSLMACYATTMAIVINDYFALVYLVTALVPSDTACLANSPGSERRTAV
jgi:hypothetical protein